MPARSVKRSSGLVTWTLVTVNVVVFMATALTADGDGKVTTSLLFRDLVLYLPWVAHGELWRVVTAGFLHFGLTHVAVNMISLAMIGPGLEYALGRGRFAAIYGTALVGSSATALWLSPDAFVAGASGALYGLLGAALVLYLRQRMNPQTIVIVLVLNLALSVTIPGISLAGHLGGLAFGVLAAGALLYAPQIGDELRVPGLACRPGALVGCVAALSVVLVLVRTLTYSG